MEYQVTARKWRPQAYKDVIGQESLVRALKNALVSGRVPHAFLFSGARGVGKTTTARILAKSLNCLNQKDAEPCNTCESCKSITTGSAMDVIEIDGASNRGIDSIREIRNTVSYLPLSSKYKVYIIDEVHMLTKEASNALLKTLEEPPEHVIFILATTEPQNVLPTIRSRCQHYNFKKIPTRVIMQSLMDIAAKENIEADEESLYLIASAADGSMRDSQSIFDQVALYCNRCITSSKTREVLGIPSEEYFQSIIQAVLAHDAVAALKALGQYLESVGDIKLFVRSLATFCRLGLMAKSLPADDPLLDLTEARYKTITGLFAPFTPEEITRLVTLLTDCYRELRGDAAERFHLEITLFKMLDYKNLVPLSDIRNELISYIDKAIAEKPQAGPARPTAQAAVSAAPPGQQPAAVPLTGPAKAAEQPAQYNKLPPRVPQVNKPEPAKVKSGPFDGDWKKALTSAMSRSILMRNMIPQLENFEQSGGILKLQVKTSYACEFLNSTQNRSELAQALLEETGLSVSISAFYHDTACVPDHDPGKLSHSMKPAEAVRPFQKPLPPVPGPQAAAAQKNPQPGQDTTKTMIELFDGKIIK